jgi:hypothetical protein
LMTSERVAHPSRAVLYDDETNQVLFVRANAS